MINKNTVFILGAGASEPYGLPTGEQLRKEILSYSSNDSYKGLFSMSGYDQVELLEFTEAFRKSGTSSIDAFLEHRPEFLEIGKIAITIIIIIHEKEGELHKGDWYRYVFEKMNTSFEEFKKNKLSVLTFNYDRSFEHFLFVVLKNLYGKSDEECRVAVESIPIIHLYGKIGALPWQGGNRPYEAFPIEELNRNINARMWIQEGIEGLKIVHEQDVKPSPEFDKAHELMNRAENIYFLGFGYHPINVERLRINSLATTNLNATGTTFGLTSNERKEVQKSLLHNIFDLEKPGAQFQKILEFLRENITLH